MTTQFKVTATAPTVYQTSSLRRFGMTVKEIGNGSFHSEQIFESEEEAKAYLVSRAEMYYDEFEGQVDEHLSTIEKNGYLEIDAVTARIEEVENEEEEENV
jgi:ketol-acid reductoisomerase